MENSLKIKQFIAVLKKRLLLILSLGFGAAILSGLYAVYVMTPIYESSTQILINKSGKDINYDYNSVMTNFQYVNTYSDMIYTPVVMEKVINELDLKVNYEELINQVKVTNNKESQVITITVENSNYSTAVKIANQVAKVFKSNVDETLELNNVTILSPAVENGKAVPIKPQPTLIIIVALIAGIIVGVGLAFLLEVMDNTITSERDIKEFLNIPVLGVVSDIQPKDLRVSTFANKELEKISSGNSQSKRIGGNAS